MGRLVESNAAGAKPPQARKAQDMRAEPRFRTHLRSGRIYDHKQRFICDCVIRDRSSNGARLLLPKNVTTPNVLCFLDEELKEFFMAEVRWRQEREIGILKLRIGSRVGLQSPPGFNREKQ